MPHTPNLYPKLVRNACPEMGLLQIHLRGKYIQSSTKHKQWYNKITNFNIFQFMIYNEFHILIPWAKGALQLLVDVHTV